MLAGLIPILVLCAMGVNAKPVQQLNEFKGHFYYIETIFKASFHEAAIVCHRMDMELVSIEPDFEFEYLRKLIKTTAVQEPEMHFWTNGVLTRVKKYLWMDTGYLVYSKNWASHSNWNDRTKGCLELWLQDREKLSLTNRECDDQLYFVCKK